MPQKSYRFASSSTHNLTAVWWKDRKDVFVMSTLHKTAVEEVMKRPKGAKEKKSTPCPSMIVDYNQNMGGVDLTDQYLSYYSLTTRRTLKWWKKVFWRLIDICVLNSWVIYRSNFPNSTINTHKLFRLKLIEELVQPLLTLRASPACPRYLYTKGRESLLLLIVASLGSTFPTSTQSGRGVQFVVRKSQLLVKEWIRKLKTCPKCNVFLCLGECFEAYHTQTSYY